MPKLSPKSKKLVKKKLTLKQKKFTTEYIKSGNATSAAKKAGYSEKTARQIATENLAKPVIQEEIQSAAAKLGIDAEYVLKNFKEIADFNKEKVVRSKTMKREDGKDPEEILNHEMRDAAAAIKSTEMLGKHLSLFTEKSEIKLDIKDDNITEDRQLFLARRIHALLSDPKLIKN